MLIKYFEVVFNVNVYYNVFQNIFLLINMVRKPMPPEATNRIEFSQVKNAFQVFKNDYGIVRHPNTPFRNPFQEPNGLDPQGYRQYNLTLIPEEMTEADFLQKLNGILVISCMDKDVALPLYNKLKDENSQTPIVFLSMAGGIVQEHDERKLALSTILTYISQHQEGITQVLATDHDHTCGYVKFVLGGTSLAEKLGVTVAEIGEHSKTNEQAAMKSLIAQNVEYHKLKQLFGDKLQLALAVIDRQGNVELDMNFNEVLPKKLSDF